MTLPYVPPSVPLDNINVPIVDAVPAHNEEPTQLKTDTVLTPTQPSTTTVPPPPQNNTSHPPPGVANGGTWGSVKHAGGMTWACCVGISILSCLVTMFPCGVFVFCCPCDEKDAYVVNGKVYNHNGDYLGHVSKMEFRRHYGVPVVAAGANTEMATVS